MILDERARRAIVSVVECETDVYEDEFLQRRRGCPRPSIRDARNLAAAVARYLGATDVEIGELLHAHPYQSMTWARAGLARWGEEVVAANARIVVGVAEDLWAEEQEEAGMQHVCHPLVGQRVRVVRRFTECVINLVGRTGVMRHDDEFGHDYLAFDDGGSADPLEVEVLPISLDPTPVKHVNRTGAVLCPHHAHQAAMRTTPQGPCHPVPEWEGGHGQIVRCDVVANPERVAGYIDYQAQASRQGREAR